MKPFLILVLLVTLMGSVLVYKMLMENYKDGFTPAKPAAAATEPETSFHSQSINQLEADMIRGYHLPDNGRPHSMNTVPSEHTVAPSSGGRWE